MELDTLKSVDTAVSFTGRQLDTAHSVNRNRDTEKSDSHASQDESVIARFGKKQQLKRRFSRLSSVGLATGLMVTWASILFSFQFGIINGGPAGLMYGFLASWLGAMLQALVMAEISSMIPLSGGPFNWVAILSPPWCRKFLSYTAGWLTIISYQAYTAAVSYTCATTLQGLIILNNPSYDPPLWHATLICYAVTFIGLSINTYLGRLLPQVNALLLILFIGAFFAVLISMGYLAPHKPAAEVFTVFQNLGGWSTMGLSFCVGWFTSVSSFIGADAPEHIAEEIHGAQRVVPFSIWFSVFLNGLLGFSILLVFLMSIGDVEQATETVTGYPFMDIMARALGSTQGATAIITVMEIVNIFSASDIMATASRTIWAFSRENGLPFSHILVKVHPKTRIPNAAIFTTIVVNLLLTLISLGSLVFYQALYAVVTSAYFSSFLLSASVMLYQRLKAPPSTLPWGPFRLGKAGVPLTILAMAYSALTMFFAFWPESPNPELEFMNFSVLIFGAAMLLAWALWFLHGRKVYVGPIWEFEGGEYIRTK